MKCPRCGSEYVTVQAITETTTKTKHRGCLGWTMWILLNLYLRTDTYYSCGNKQQDQNKN